MRKLLYTTLSRLGHCAYRFQQWWEAAVLSRLDRWADYFNDDQ